MDAAPGARGTAETVVGPGNLASTVDSGALDVFSTPMMIALMERAAFTAVQPFLGEGMTTVGTRVDVRHTAPTPPGERVTATAVLERVTGSRLLFSVNASDSSGTVGEGVHERVVVDIAAFLGRLDRRGR